MNEGNIVLERVGQGGAAPAERGRARQYLALRKWRKIYGKNLTEL